MQKWITKIINVWIFILLLLGLFFITTSAYTPNGDVPIDIKSGIFVPQINNTTRVDTNIPIYKNTKNPYHTYALADKELNKEYHGKYYLRYKNVGSIGNKNVDLIIKLVAWAEQDGVITHGERFSDNLKLAMQRYQNNSPLRLINIAAPDSYRKGNTSAKITLSNNIPWIKIEQYIEYSDSTPIGKGEANQGTIVVSDLDYSQSITYDTKDIDIIDTRLSKDTIITQSRTDNNYKLASSYIGSNNEANSTAILNIKYKEGNYNSKIRFTYHNINTVVSKDINYMQYINKNSIRKGSDLDINKLINLGDYPGDNNLINGYYFESGLTVPYTTTFSSELKKRVSDEDEFGKINNSLHKIGEYMQYSVDGYIPSIAGNNLSQFIFYDTLDSRLVLDKNSFKVKVADKDITNMGDLKFDNNKLEWKAKKEFLEKKDFWGQSIYYTYKVKSLADLGDLPIKNKAYQLASDFLSTSNETITSIQKRGYIKIIKHYNSPYENVAIDKASFNIYDDKNNLITTIVTKNGLAISDEKSNISINKAYVIKENNLSGFIKNTRKYTVNLSKEHITNSSAYTLDVVNTPFTFSMQLEKYDLFDIANKKDLEKIAFDLYAIDLNIKNYPDIKFRDNKLVGTAYVKDNKIIFNNLIAGRYKLIERNKNSKLAELGGEVIFENLGNGTNIISDSISENAIIQAKKIGITPIIKKNAIANISKIARIKVLKMLNYDKTDINSNKIYAEAGITFDIKDSRGVVVDSIITDKNGIAYSKFLKLGAYTIVQKNPALDANNKIIGLKATPKDIILTEPFKVHDIAIINKPNKMKLKIIKKDARTEKIIQCPNIEFSIYYSANNKKVNLKSENGFTDRIILQNGEAITYCKLQAGEYYLKEIKGPKGYYFDKETKYYFTIPDKPGDLEISLNIQDTITKEILNVPQYGVLEINKRGELYKGTVDTSKTLPIQSNGNIKKIIKSVPRENVQLNVERYYEKDTDVENGTENDKDTVTAIDKFTILTNSYGEAELKADSEKYIIKENDKIISTYNIDKPKTIIVKLKNESKTESKYQMGTVNKKSFDIKKFIWKKEKLDGAVFTLIASENIKSSDGKNIIIKKGEELLFNNKGEALLKSELNKLSINDRTKVHPYFITQKGKKMGRIPLGKYILKEIKAPKGFILDNKTYDIEFTPQNHTLKFDSKLTEEIVNKRQRLKIQLNKNIIKPTEFFNRYSIENIVIGLYKGNTLINVYAPNHEGIILTDELIGATYKLKILNTKDTYLLNSKEYKITIEEDDNNSEEIINVLKEDIWHEPILEPKDKIIPTIKNIDIITKKSIEGNEFTMYAITPISKIKVRDSHKSDEKGEIHIDNLPIGTYSLENSKAKKGYLPVKKFFVGNSKDKQISSLIESIPTKTRIIAVDSHTGKHLNNVNITILDENNNIIHIDRQNYSYQGDSKNFVISKNGKLIYALHQNNTYKIKTNYIPKGYLENKPFDFTINEQEGEKIVIIRYPLSETYINKVNDNNENLKGAELHLLEDGKPFIDKLTKKAVVITSKNHDSKGFKVYGMNNTSIYTIVETKAPINYIKPQKNMSFSGKVGETIKVVNYKKQPLIKIMPKTSVAFSINYLVFIISSANIVFIKKYII